ncbi:hypothetical protein [Sorangium sp. So ce233]|uniref:hypothetical protein n=1 Tax=Sorangium sp. So ce233 TaxID=3133290 RepID=UPI003F5D584E
MRGSVGAGVLLLRASAFAEGPTDHAITERGSEEHPHPLELGEQAIGSIPFGVYTSNRKDEILIQDEGANQCLSAMRRSLPPATPARPRSTASASTCR